MRYSEELIALLRLAIPLIIALLAQIGIAVIDSIMMGYLGPNALAEGALALGAYMLLLVFSLGLVSAISVCIAQAKGAKQDAMITIYLQQGAYFIVLISVPMILLLWYMAPILLLLQPLRSMESCKRRRVVRDSARFFNQPAGMLKNLYVRVESLENAVRSYPEVTELRLTRTVAAN